MCLIPEDGLAQYHARFKKKMLLLIFFRILSNLLQRHSFDEYISWKRCIVIILATVYRTLSAWFDVQSVLLSRNAIIWFVCTFVVVNNRNYITFCNQEMRSYRYSPFILKCYLIYNAENFMFQSGMWLIALRRYKGNVFVHL